MLRHGMFPVRLMPRLQGKNYRWPRRRSVPEWFFWPTWNTVPGPGYAYLGYIEEKPGRSIIDGRPIYPQKFKLPDDRKKWKARRA